MIYIAVYANMNLNKDERGAALEIIYKNKSINKVCTDANAARKEYGIEMARKIHFRIDQISVAETVDQLVLFHIGRCHALHGDRKGQFAMDLVHPYRLVFAKVHNEVKIVEVQEIVDYH